jgi:NADH:ubiquinone oxidoreductase subunit C
VQGADENSFVEALLKSYPELVEEARVLRPKRVSILARREKAVRLAEILRDEYGFIHPISAGAVDYPKDMRIQVIYYLTNPSQRFILTLRVNLPRNDSKLPSMTRVWSAMDFHEREVMEMFGVEFEGHPNPSRLLLPPNWRGGYPLRKDFKGEGVEV